MTDRRAPTRPARRALLALVTLAVTAGLACAPGGAAPYVAPSVGAGRAPIGVEGERAPSQGGRPAPTAASLPEATPRPTARAPEEAARPATIAPDTDALRAALDRARWAYGIYGVEFAVATSAGDWAVASGVARDGRTPLTPEVPSAVGSATKTFIAALVIDLAEEDLIGLDDRVREHLPSLPVAPAVTVRDLLAHTSGIADLFGPLEAALRSDPGRVYTPAEVLEKAGPAWFAPGAGFAYSNTNYVILGLLVEEVTGKPVADALEERIFEPLGLTSGELGTGIGPEGRPILDPAWATGFWTSGAITATARDLARWGADLFGGRFLDADSISTMTAFDRDDYGLGVQRLHLDGAVAYGHSGLLSTYTSLLVHFPREQVTVAVLANRAEVDLASFLLHREADHPSLLDLALRAAPRR